MGAEFAQILLLHRLVAGDRINAPEQVQRGDIARLLSERAFGVFDRPIVVAQHEVGGRQPEIGLVADRAGITRPVSAPAHRDCLLECLDRFGGSVHCQ